MTARSFLSLLLLLTAAGRTACAWTVAAGPAASRARQTRPPRIRARGRRPECGRTREEVEGRCMEGKTAGDFLPAP